MWTELCYKNAVWSAACVRVRVCAPAAPRETPLQYRLQYMHGPRGQVQYRTRAVEYPGSHVTARTHADSRPLLEPLVPDLAGFRAPLEVEDAQQRVHLLGLRRKVLLPRRPCAPAHLADLPGRDGRRWREMAGDARWREMAQLAGDGGRWREMVGDGRRPDLPGRERAQVRHQ